MKRRGRKQRTRVKRRGRKKSRSRRRKRGGAGKTHYVKKDGSVTGEWVPGPDGEHPRFALTGSVGAINNFYDAGNEAGSRKITGEKSDKSNWWKLLPEQVVNVNKWTESNQRKYMDDAGYTKLMDAWFQGLPATTNKK